MTTAGPTPPEEEPGVPESASRPDATAGETSGEAPTVAPRPSRACLPLASAPAIPSDDAGQRPIAESLRRRSVRLTPPQSDALGRLLATRRLVELLALRNGTLATTFQGAGYRTWRAYITADGRVLENSDASEPDPTGEAEGALTIVREPGRLHLGVILPSQTHSQD